MSGRIGAARQAQGEGAKRPNVSKSGRASSRSKPTPMQGDPQVLPNQKKKILRLSAWMWMQLKNETKGTNCPWRCLAGSRALPLDCDILQLQLQPCRLQLVYRRASQAALLLLSHRLLSLETVSSGTIAFGSLPRKHNNSGAPIEGKIPTFLVQHTT